MDDWTRIADDGLCAMHARPMAEGTVEIKLVERQTRGSPEGRTLTITVEGNQSDTMAACLIKIITRSWREGVLLTAECHGED